MCERDRGKVKGKKRETEGERGCADEEKIRQWVCMLPFVCHCISVASMKKKNKTKLFERHFLLLFFNVLPLIGTWICLFSALHFFLQKKTIFHANIRTHARTNAKTFQLFSAAFRFCQLSSFFPRQMALLFSLSPSLPLVYITIVMLFFAGSPIEVWHC